MNDSKGDAMNFKHQLRRGTTFALLLFGLLAILAPDPASAQLLVGKAGPYASLPPCSLDPIHNSAGRFAVLTDATIAAGVVTGGSGGPAIAWCPLSGSDWRALAAPIASDSGAIERAVTNVTVADDAAGTKPAGVTPITTDFATCTCNDATGCTMSVAEPTPTTGYGRSLTIVSAGTGNCEYADSAGVTEIGAAVVLEPTSVLTLVYANAAWHRLSTADNVP